MSIVLVKSEEISITTVANSVSNASLVRVMNTSNTDIRLIKVRDSGNNVLGSFSLGWAGSEGSVHFVRKDFTDTIEADANGAVVATSVGYY